MHAPVQTYTVNVRTVGNGISQATAASRHGTIEADTSAGQMPECFGPADLLVTAFAACVLKNVERMSRMLPFRYDGASIAVTAERETQPPRLTRLRYTLRIVTDEPTHRLDLLHRNIAKYGTIYNTIAAACDVEGAVVVEPRAAAPTEAVAR